MHTELALKEKEKGRNRTGFFIALLLGFEWFRQYLQLLMNITLTKYA